MKKIIRKIKKTVDKSIFGVYNNLHQFILFFPKGQWLSFMLTMTNKFYSFFFGFAFYFSKVFCRCVNKIHAI